MEPLPVKDAAALLDRYNWALKDVFADGAIEIWDSPDGVAEAAEHNTVTGDVTVVKECLITQGTYTYAELEVVLRSSQVADSFEVSFYRGISDNTPLHETFQWATFTDKLTTFTETYKRENLWQTDRHMWSPTSYQEGGLRRAVDAHSVSMLVLDYDDGVSWEALTPLWKDRGLTYAIHTSWSHNVQKGGEPPCDRWRAVFPLAQPAQPVRWRDLYARAADWLSNGAVWCKGSNRITQHFWLPVCKPGAETYIEVNEGAPLDINNVPGDLGSEPVLNKEQGEVPRPEAIPEYGTPYKPDPDDGRPGTDYSACSDHAALFEEYGWVYVETEGNNERWRRPGKSDGWSATWHTERRCWYVFSPNAPPFEKDIGLSLFQCYALLEHKGDFNAAGAALAAKGYGASGLRVLNGCASVDDRDDDEQGDESHPVDHTALLEANAWTQVDEQGDLELWGHASGPGGTWFTESETFVVTDEVASLEPGKIYSARELKSIWDPSGADASVNWRSSLSFRVFQNGNRRLENTAANLALYLTHDDPWRGTLLFDELQYTPRWCRTPPPLEGFTPPSGQLKDHHITYVQAAGRQLHNALWEYPIVIRAVETAARENTIHPVRDYLESLTWDGVPRADSWLTTYMNAEPTPAPVGKWWLISAVARAFDPGCQVDHMLVLQGPQGIRKSTAVRILGQPWYCGSLGDLKTKEGAHSLTGVWIMEIAELDAFRGAASSRVKDFLTKTFDHYRPPYGHFYVDRPRQCVFVGTTNEREFLHDSTGARRFWPVGVSSVDIGALDRDRDQIWAEAVTLYKSGARYWPQEADEINVLAKVAEERYAVDPWEQAMRGYLKGKAYITLNTCLDLLQIKLETRHAGHHKRLTKILRRLGWDTGPRKGNVRHWYPQK